MDGSWHMKKRLTQPPPPPKRKPRFTKAMARKRELDSEDLDWLLGGGPPVVDGPPTKVKCSPPSSEDDNVFKKPLALRVVTEMAGTTDEARDASLEDEPPLPASPIEGSPTEELLHETPEEMGQPHED